MIGKRDCGERIEGTKMSFEQYLEISINGEHDINFAIDDNRNKKICNTVRTVLLIFIKKTNRITFTLTS